MFAAAGVKLRRSLLTHLNRGYVKRGNIDARELFVVTDVTDAVAQECGNVPERIAELQSVIRNQQPPIVEISRHCDEPYECPLKSTCWAFLPEHNVAELHRGKQKGFALLADGVSRIADIPGLLLLSPLQTIQRRAIVEGRPQLDLAALRRFLAKLKYPIHFLDFETYQTAVPRTRARTRINRFHFSSRFIFNRRRGLTSNTGRGWPMGQKTQTGVHAESASGIRNGRLAHCVQCRIREALTPRMRRVLP